jgi:hypothetical protein
VNLDSFCDQAHNVFTGDQREQSRLIFNEALSGYSRLEPLLVDVYYLYLTS